MLFAVPAHHSCGSCSDHSGFGVCRVRGVVAEATTAPFSSTSSALAPVVETSMPRKSLRDLPTQAQRLSDTREECSFAPVEPGPELLVASRPWLSAQAADDGRTELRRLHRGVARVRLAS